MSSRDPGDIAGDAVETATETAQGVADDIDDPRGSDGVDLLDPVPGSDQLSEDQRRRTLRNLSRPQARGLAARATGPEFDRDAFDVSDGELQLSDDARQRLAQNDAVDTGEQSRGDGQRTSVGLGAVGSALGAVGSAIGSVGRLPSAQFDQTTAGRGGDERVQAAAADLDDRVDSVNVGPSDVRRTPAGEFALSDEAQRQAALPDVRASVRETIEEPVPETPSFVDAPTEPLNSREADEVAQSIGPDDLQQVEGGRVGLDASAQKRVAAADIDSEVPVDVTAADIERTESGEFRLDEGTLETLAERETAQQFEEQLDTSVEPGADVAAVAEDGEIVDVGPTPSFADEQLPTIDPDELVASGERFGIVEPETAEQFGGVETLQEETGVPTFVAGGGESGTVQVPDSDFDIAQTLRTRGGQTATVAPAAVDAAQQAPNPTTEAFRDIVGPAESAVTSVPGVEEAADVTADVTGEAFGTTTDFVGEVAPGQAARDLTGLATDYSRAYGDLVGRGVGIGADAVADQELDTTPDSDAANIFGGLAEGAVTGAGSAVASLPAAPFETGEISAEAAAAVGENVAEQGVTEGTIETAGEAGDVAGDAAEAASQQFQENPAQTIGLTVGGVVGGVATGALAGRALGAGARRLQQSGVGRAIRTAGGEEVPYSQLAQQSVRSGDERFPGAEDEPRYRRDPSGAVSDQATRYTPDAIQQRFDDLGVEGATLKKALDVEPKGPERGRAARGLDASPDETGIDPDNITSDMLGGPDSPGSFSYENPGSFASPELSKAFLRLDDARQDPEFSLLPGVPDLRADKPTGVLFRTPVKEPDADTQLGFARELARREGETEARTKPAGSEQLNPGEIEAVAPPGASFVDVGGSGIVRNTLRRAGIGSDFYTVVDGKRVPLRLAAPESEVDNVGIRDRIRQFVGDEDAQVGRGAEGASFRSLTLDRRGRAGPPVDRPLPPTAPATSSVVDSEPSDGSSIVSGRPDPASVPSSTPSGVSATDSTSVVSSDPTSTVPTSAPTSTVPASDPTSTVPASDPPPDAPPGDPTPTVPAGDPTSGVPPGDETTVPTPNPTPLTPTAPSGVPTVPSVGGGASTGRRRDDDDPEESEEQEPLFILGERSTQQINPIAKLGQRGESPSGGELPWL